MMQNIFSQAYLLFIYLFLVIFSFKFLPITKKIGFLIVLSLNSYLYILSLLLDT